MKKKAKKKMLLLIMTILRGKETLRKYTAASSWIIIWELFVCLFVICLEVKTLRRGGGGGGAGAQKKGVQDGRTEGGSGIPKVAIF